MSRLPEIITIDGPAGVGKSTLAGRVAEALGVACLDTGAMFRTVALNLVKAGLTPDSDLSSVPGLNDLLQRNTFSLRGSGRQTQLLCNGLVVGNEVRSEEAGMMAAHVARSVEVRAFLKAAQQRLGSEFSLVTEGRDMGSVIFPAALCKIFLDATPEVRAERRCRQLEAMGLEADREELAQQIAKRDELDRKRLLAPLKPAFDAVSIDSSNLDIDAVFKAIMDEIKLARAALPPETAMRRKDRSWPISDALALLDAAEYGVLALDDGEGWPYAVQLSFVSLDGALYFHSAGEGRKVRALTRNPRVCFTVTGATRPVYTGDFSTYFQSAMVIGEARLVTDDEEAYRALWALAEKYLPEHMDKADKDIKRSFKRTAVYRIAPRIISGKAKREKPA